MVSRVFETIKTVIIFLLCVTMLVMTLLLMIVDQEGTEAAYPFEERMIFYENGAEAADGQGMNTSRMLPSAIAFRAPTLIPGEGDATLRAVSDGEILPRVYATLYPLLRQMLGHAAVRTVPSNGAQLWEAARAGDILLYLSYPEDLPTALLYAYTFADSENGENLSLSTNSVYGREFLFFEDETGEISLLVRDKIGSVAQFTVGNEAHADTIESGVPDMATEGNGEENTASEIKEDASPIQTPAEMAENESAALHASELSAYIETVGNLANEAHLACFLCELPDYHKKSMEKDDPPFTQDEEKDNSNLAIEDVPETKVQGAYRFGGKTVGADTALIYLSPRALSCASVTTFAGMHVLDASEGEGLYRLLHTFGMRDSAAENHYVDRDGGRVYLDSDGRLYISASGTLHYTALQNGGIAGSAFLGYSNVSGVYTLSESMQISDRLVSVCSERIVPMLCGISAADGVPTADSVLKTPILSISAVELEEGVSGVRTVYGYSINGVLVRDETGAILESYSVVVSGDDVISFSVTPLYGVSGETTEVLLPMRVALEALTYENTSIGDRYGVLDAAYVLERASYRQTLLKPEWIFSEK